MVTNNLTRFSFPPLIALALYWPGLTSWFQKDDFVWLGLRGMVHNAHDLRWALFTPLSQGTLRILSERVYFMSFYSLFGLHALPYKLLAFLVFSASLVLLNAVCAKLTGSRAAGFWAAILWTVNAAMGYVLSWTSITNQLFCGLIFLLSFWFLLRYVETSDRRFNIAQWTTFALGFGMLELNVVYPALALAYTLCCARRFVPKVIPLFILSAIYTVIHIKAVALPASGPYKMYWDASIFSMLWGYWKVALGPNRLIYMGVYPSMGRSALAVALTIGLLGFLFWKLWKREWLAAFFAAWFVIVLAPLLPLRDHFTDAYLAVPLIGLAMWGAWALTTGWSAGGSGRIAAILLASIYLCVAVPVARVNAVSFCDTSHKIERMVRSVVRVSRSEPGKMILLKGVDSMIFWDGLYNRPFRLFISEDVYVVAENQPSIVPSVNPDYAGSYFMNAAKARDALDQSRAVVYDVSSGEAKDITTEYRATP